MKRAMFVLSSFIILFICGCKIDKEYLETGILKEATYIPGTRWGIENRWRVTFIITNDISSETILVIYNFNAPLLKIGDKYKIYRVRNSYEIELDKIEKSGPGPDNNIQKSNKEE